MLNRRGFDSRKKSFAASVAMEYESCLFNSEHYMNIVGYQDTGFYTSMWPQQNVNCVLTIVLGMVFIHQNLLIIISLSISII